MISNSAQLSFNPRLHAGGDTNACNQLVNTLCFNPRLHAGGDEADIETLM